MKHVTFRVFFIVLVIFIMMPGAYAAAQTTDAHHPGTPADNKPGNAEDEPSGQTMNPQGMMPGQGMMNMGSGAANENAMPGPSPVSGAEGGMMGMMMSHMMNGGMMSMMDRMMSGGMMGMMDRMMGGGMMGMMPSMAGSGMQGRKMDPEKMMMQRLFSMSNMDLTPEQWTEVRKTAFDFLMKLHTLRAEREKLGIEGAYIMSDKQVNMEEGKKVFSRLGEIQFQISMLNRDYLTKIKSILTPDQVQKLTQ